MRTRRQFLFASALMATASSLSTTPLFGQSPAPAPGNQPKRPPNLPADKVQAVVGQSHRSLENVRKLVEETPLLVNAVWDWGGGDFETPLEAASHVGQREIAEFLISRGARPSLYAAGMLGQLDVVKAFLALDPQAHAIPGPHGFTLLHCVRAGGERAKPVLDWLLANGVPDVNHRELDFKW